MHAYMLYLTSENTLGKWWVSELDEGCRSTILSFTTSDRAECLDIINHQHWSGRFEKPVIREERAVTSGAALIKFAFLSMKTKRVSSIPRENYG